MFKYWIKQTKEWGDFLSTMGWKTICTSNKVAVFYLPVGKLFSISKIQRPRNLTKIDLDEIDKIAEDKKFLFSKIEPGPEQELKILVEYDYKINATPLSPPTTLVTDLKEDENTLWEKVSHSAKYSINRARREGDYVTFKTAFDEEDIKRFYAIHKHTGVTKKFYIEPYNIVKKKFDVYKGKCVLAEVFNKNNEIISAKLFGLLDDTVIYFLGGTSDLGRKSKGGYLLVWESILYFKNKGHAWIDWEGLDDPRFKFATKAWGGFSHFKEKFPGEKVIFPYPYIKLYSKLLKFVSRFQRLDF